MRTSSALLFSAFVSGSTCVTDVAAHVSDNRIPDAQQVVPHPPTDGRDATSWCGAHMARREFVAALFDCNYAVRENPSSAMALSNRGSLFLVTGSLREALQDFEAALRLTPADANLYFNRGLAHAKLGERDLAIKDYSEAIRLKPDFAIAFHNRGYEFELARRRDEAIADYNRALSIDPRLKPSIDGLKRLQNNL